MGVRLRRQRPGRAAVDAGRLFFGSFDGSVYALDAAAAGSSGSATPAPVVSTPAAAGDRIVVGNRGYDLLGLDARTGEPA